MLDRFKTFTLLVTNINRSIRKIKTEEMAEYNLKSIHISCLYFLYKSEKLTAKELCDICDEDKAAMSRSIDYLEKNDFIKCDSNAKKRYNASFYLTEKGIKISKLICEKIDKILNKASETLSEENRQILYKSLSLINDNLQKICNDYEEK